MVRDGLIVHCSVEFDWERLDKLNGVAPRGIEFTGLSLLKDIEPGDPRTTVELWEGILRHLRGEEKMVAQDMRTERPILHERIWTSRYINNLPDSAFAVIEPGGEKDEEGNTVPRSLRHYPHHNASGAVDIPHLRNANSRVNITNLSEELRKKALEHLDAHKKELGIGAHADEAETQKGSGTVGGNIPAWADGIILDIESAIQGIEEEAVELKRRVGALEQSGSPLKRNQVGGRALGEGVIERNPVAEEPKVEYELIDEVLEMLPESVPPRVGYFSTELVRRLRKNLLEKKAEIQRGTALVI